MGDVDRTETDSGFDLATLPDTTKSLQCKIQHSDKMAPKEIFSAKFSILDEQIELIAGTVTELEYDKVVYWEIQTKMMEDTGCVYMYPCAGSALVIEEFGTDMRQYPINGFDNLQISLTKLAEVNTPHSCDLKPRNLLWKVRPGGIYELKLCDFDCATRIGECFKWVLPDVCPALTPFRDLLAYDVSIREPTSGRLGRWNLLAGVEFIAH